MSPIRIYVGETKRAQYICQALSDGFFRHGIPHRFCRPQTYVEPESDIAVFYGLSGKLKQIFMDYKRSGRKAVLVDLGYWRRVLKGKLNGYHKVVVNDYHPNHYFNTLPDDPARFKKLHIEVKPFHKGGKHILLAGMSSKSAWANNLISLEYEQFALSQLKQYTTKPVIYRPKPSWKGAAPIEGADYSEPCEPLSAVLNKECFCVVTHHSNVAVDALVEGIPVLVKGPGVAKLLGRHEFKDIEKPLYPSSAKRKQFLNRLAHCQWQPSEIESGALWDFLKQVNLI